MRYVSCRNGQLLIAKSPLAEPHYSLAIEELKTLEIPLNNKNFNMVIRGDRNILLKFRAGNENDFEEWKRVFRRVVGMRNSQDLDDVFRPTADVGQLPNRSAAVKLPSRDSSQSDFHDCRDDLSSQGSVDVTIRSVRGVSFQPQATVIDEGKDTAASTKPRARTSSTICL